MEKKPNLEKVGRVLVSPPKYGIVVTLGKEPESFTDIKRELDIPSGTLNYHLLVLQKDGLVEKRDDGEYQLSPEGRRVFDIAKDVALKESEE